MKFQEIVTELKNLLKENLTAENVDKITAIDKKVDELNSEATKLESQNQELKDKIVAQVKNTIFKQEDNASEDEEPSSIEEVMMKSYENTKDKYKTKNFR